ncbi:hypothetical protein FB451DRAFT_1409447 [Mycena latifolia]|nr:hypothetical protein FB451DRAFT_1409447 [Mycena latifolia]
MGGALAPGLTTFGSGLGLNKIKLERSTAGGRVFDALTMARAFDGLQIAGRNTLYTYRRGVTTAVVAPTGSGFLQGISTAFSTGAPNALADRAILQSATALHISIQSEMRASVSTQIAALRNVLFSSSAPGPWRRVKAGEIPLIVKIHNPDIMTTLLLLKAEFEASTSATPRMTFAGAPEVHLLPPRIGAAGVSVILAPARPYPESWDYHRTLPSPPPSRKMSVMTLLQRAATLALSVQSEYATRNVMRASSSLGCVILRPPTPLTNRAQAALDAAIDYATSTTNVDPAPGRSGEELVIYQGGGLLDLESKVLGVLSGRRAIVDLF